MEWRVTIELSGADGTRQTHEVTRGGCADPHSTLDPLGLTLDDGEALLAGVQQHLVQAWVAEYSALRRHCVFRPGSVTPDRRPKVTPSSRRFPGPYQWDIHRMEGSLFKVDRVPD
jgi:hypothetical protein